MSLRFANDSKQPDSRPLTLSNRIWSFTGVTVTVDRSASGDCFKSRSSRTRVATARVWSRLRSVVIADSPRSGWTMSKVVDAEAVCGRASSPTTPRTPPMIVAPTQMQTDLRTMIDRSSMLANPRGIEIAVGADNVVVLRGAVRDEDEAKTAEGMIRLTPGVREVRNELKYPAP